jgi:hypothetical protein
LLAFVSSTCLQADEFCSPDSRRRCCIPIDIACFVCSLVLVLSNYLPADNYRSPDTCRRCCPSTTSLVLTTIAAPTLVAGAAHRLLSKNLYSGFCRSRSARSSAFVAGATRHCPATTFVSGAAYYPRRFAIIDTAAASTRSSWSSPRSPDSHRRRCTALD